MEASSNDAEWRKGLMTFEMLMEERFEDGVAKGREKGIEQGAYNNKLETAKKLLAISLPLEQIAGATELPLKTVIELKDMA